MKAHLRWRILQKKGFSKLEDTAIEIVQNKRGKKGFKNEQSIRKLDLQWGSDLINQSTPSWT